MSKRARESERKEISIGLGSIARERVKRRASKRQLDEIASENLNWPRLSFVPLVTSPKTRGSENLRYILYTISSNGVSP